MFTMPFPNPLKFYNYILTLSILLSSCGGGNEEEKPETASADSTITSPVDSSAIKTQKIFYSLPSPIEMATLIRKTGANYNKEILNPVDNVSKYSTTQSRALNLGVYGADLSYTSIFDQTQETMFYISCVKKLADAMGITSAFNQTTVQRMQNNLNNQDSVLQIVSDSYMETDDFLKSNERANSSALVIAGGWIEGLYIATKIAEKNKNNKEIIQRIAEQKLSINDLISLLKSHPADPTVTSIIKKLTELQTIYNELKVTGGPVKVETNSATGVTTIGGDSRVEISNQQLSQITAKVTEIRNNIIK